MVSGQSSTGRLTRWVALIAVVVVAAGALFLVLGGDDEPRLTNLDRVLVDLEDQVRARPQDLDARIAVAAAYAVRGRVDDAIAQYEQALLLEPDSEAALIGLGSVLADEDRFDEAFTPLERVAELNADNPLRYTIDALEAVYYDLARIHVARGEFEQAEGRVLEALEVNRTDADAWLLLGDIQAHQGDIDAAEEALVNATRLVPDYDEAYIKLRDLYDRAGRDGGRQFAEGMLRVIDGDASGAVDLLSRAVVDEPDFGDAHQALGIALEEAGRAPEALDAYRRAVAIDPDLFVAALAVQRLELSLQATPTAASGD